ncbi:hypothetical protein B2A_05841, partial [mine drainage metagenome]
ELAPPVVLAPVTAHYSWSKGMKMLGLGREQLRLIPERGMRLDITAFEQTLRDLRCRGRFSAAGGRGFRHDRVRHHRSSA